jgi:DNA-binding XRE family transcriptional regulator
MNTKLYELRKGKGLSQAKLAEKAKINRTTYLNVEKGRTPELFTAISIADALGINNIETLRDIFLS